MSETNYRQIRRTRANDIPKTLKRIASYMKKYKVEVIFAVITLMLDTASVICSNVFYEPVINDYVVPFIGQKDVDLSNFVRMLILMAVVYVIGVIACYAHAKLLSIVSTGILDDLRVDLFNHMQTLPVKFYDTHTHGELMNYYTNDVDMVRPLIADTFPTLITTVVNVVGVVVVMLIYSPKLTLITLGLIVVVLTFTFIFGKIGRGRFADLQRSISNINGYAEEIFLGQKVVKVFCHEDKTTEQFEKYSKECYKAAVIVNTFTSILMPVNGNLSYIAYALVAVVGARLTVSGQMDLGKLTAFLLLSRTIAGPISNLSQQFNGLMMAIAGAERVFGILDTPSEVDEGDVTLVPISFDENGNIVEEKQRTNDYAWKVPNENGFEYVQLKGDIRFNEVTFAYRENHDILKNISLYAKPGQKIAFVGSTGAGKTTITNLINRFYDVQKGVITYDGIDVKRIKKASLRSSLGMVLQDTNLFTGTVIDNIRYGRLDATDEECIQAAKLANADSYINRLPDGYNTMLTANGANLSQGQRQLLNIARAAVSMAPVIILDEATSSIDTHTEAQIEKGMDNLMKGKTVFVIAHRLSTVRNSNAIIVLEHGQIIERGDHEDLLKNKGRYYQLYTGKAELD